jgi:hypothetical protein
MSDTRLDSNERWTTIVSAEHEARRLRVEALAAVARADCRSDAARALGEVLDVDLDIADNLLDLPLHRFIDADSHGGR